MLTIKSIQSKHKFADPDHLILYKYMPETIKELSQDLEIIEKIVTENGNDNKVLNLCKVMKSKLSDSFKYLTDKLKNIPNKHYLEESDEDWVDEHMPIFESAKMATDSSQSAQKEQPILESEAADQAEEICEQSEQTLSILTFERKLNTLSDIDVAATFDLDLKIIIKKYDTQSKLEANDRIILCKSLVKCFLLEDNDKKMRKADFERISSLIARKFTTELTSTYYVKASKKKRACGKLYDTYQHLRSDLIKVGLATKSSYKRRETEVEPGETDETEVDDNQPALDIEFLEAHGGPWDEVTVAWGRTCELRLKSLKGVSVAEYMNTYPALYSNKGLELLAVDAIHLYPNLPNLVNVLEEIGGKLMDNIRLVRPFPFANLLIQNPSPEWTNALILISLPYLLPTVYSRVNNKSVRLSKAEVSSRFFPYFQTKGERDNHYDESVNNAEKFKVPLQPSIHMFGNFVSPICVVTVERQPFFIDNPVAAFELYFKSLFALDMKYPEGSEQVWLFVQKKFFGIVTDQDPVFPAVETLINSM